MEFRYSQEFKRFAGGEKRLRAIVAGAGAGHEKFRTYARTRFFISRAITHAGTILDIGCANGFLIRCLQEWSGHKLVPYGVDRDPALIRQARALFPGRAENFIVADLVDEPDMKKIWPHRHFDYIYWNVWDNYVFGPESKVELLGPCFRQLSRGGRLILGFYESDRNKTAKIRHLGDLGFTRALRNPYHRHHGEVIVWKDKR
ncbi:MAG: class I SAM-dependent methyltransferase [Candidatus Omnitrophica bacterium]|jgi:SAM-dependent methyltransferase|nr:class I SAM-dependent methyltransferase [Candidatus Omnitrophota bacterium]MDD5537700.1 class I SAM-dependent methyltransferase [Candidatus Omnitrophota bacterium]